MPNAAASDVIGDFADMGILDGDAQPASPSKRTDDDAPPARGELLDLADKSPEKAAKKVKAMWELQDPAAERRKPQWDANKLALMGFQGIRARPVSTDVNRWELYVPPGALDRPPTLEQPETLIDRLVSHLLQDEPKADCTPEKDTPQDRDAAEFAERWLEVDGSSSAANDALLFRMAEKKAAIFGSGFIYSYVEADGGGWEEIAGPDGQPQRRWIAKICSKVIPSYLVRPIPDIAINVQDADGMFVMDLTTVGDLKRRFQKETEAWSAAIWQEVVDWKPKAAKWAMPWFVQTRMRKTPETNDDGTPTDAATVVTLAVYYTARGEYPDGAYLLTAGGDQLLYHGPWLDASTALKRSLDVPVTQIKQLTDDVSDDFYGRGLMQPLGPIGEVRSMITLAWLAHLDRSTYPHLMLPLGSVVQPDQWASRDGRALYFNPEGQPVVEQVPPFDPQAVEFFDRAKAAEDDVVGIYADAAGAGNTAVRSGSHAALEVQQSEVNLAQIAQNLGDGIERLWRIKLQLARAFIREEQRTQVVGPDGAYKEKAWSGANFRGVRDVRIKPGTFTQMAPGAKEQLIMMRMTTPLPDGSTLVSADEGRRLLSGNMRSDIGLRDNPAVEKIRRELSAWREGPTPEWTQQAEEAAQGNRQAEAAHQFQAQEAAAQGMQAPEFQPPYAMPAGPFVRVAADDEQDVARIRHAEMRREMMSTSYEHVKDMLWRDTFGAEYAAMKQAAGITTLAEQAQQQQQQMEQQQAQQAQQAEQQIALEREKAQGRIAEDTAQAGLDVKKAAALATIPTPPKAPEPPQFQ